MDEVRPGIWIGNIRAITQLDQNGDSKSINRNNNSCHTRWTVITILKDDKLLRFVRSAITEYRKREQDDALKLTEVVKHIEWILPDTLHANFVSPQLLNILVTLKSAIHPTNCSLSLDKMKVMNACLVHCAQGISRSAAVIVAFLLYSRDFTTIQEALDAIRIVRPCVQPNIGLLAGLRAIEQCHGNVDAAMERMKRHEIKNAQQSDGTAIKI